MAKRGSGSLPLLVFLGVAFGGSTLLPLVIGLLGGNNSPLFWLAPLIMFVSARGVLDAHVTLGAHVCIQKKCLPLRWLHLFEEIGRRAFMPRLVDCFGVHRATAASALICALWHIQYAFSGVQQVENVFPLVLALVGSVGQFGAGLFLAVLWLKTSSILLVSLAHGALTNRGRYAFRFMNTSGERDLALLILVNAALLVVGVGVLARTPQGLHSLSHPS